MNFPQRVVSFALVFLSFSSIFALEKTANNYVEGELLVKFKNGTASSAAFSVNSKFGAKIAQEFPDLGWQVVKLPEKMSLSEGLANYRSSDEIIEAQPNYIYHVQNTPNDVQYSSLYGMTRIGAPTAWDTTTGSANVVVAVIDTGVRYTHEDIAANMWRNPAEISGNGIDDDGNGYIDDYYGYDFINNDSDPNDDYDHGTHVAGTIGAAGNNTLGVVGVNWNVKIMALKIHDNTGNSTSAKIIEAYNYVRMMKNRGVNIRVTNNSYGGCNEACGYDQATKDAIDAASNQNLVTVFAAGNGNYNNDVTPSYPASYVSPNLISVAASTSTDARSSFSQWGPTSVDVAAPGSGIISLTRTADNSYGSKSGTSMATPHTAGAIALLSAANPNLSAASLKATLMNTVDQMPAWNGIVLSGGRINVSTAILNQTVCSYNLSANGQTVASSGTSSSVGVTTQSNCDYSIKSNDSWISVTTTGVASGSQNVSFTVAANSAAQRIGTITIGGRTFTVTQSGTAPLNRAILDFDGDGKTDYSAIQNVNGSMIWHNQRSGSGYSATTFGLFSSDIAVPNDFDGDGKTDVAIWRVGVFWVFRSSDSTYQVVQFGIPTDNPKITQDFDGDGKADFAVTRKSGGYTIWYVLQTTGGFRAVLFGLDSDTPLRGDFDGDGKADIAVFRPSAVVGIPDFYVLRSSDGAVQSVEWGTTGDLPVIGDFDGDGKADYSIYRPNTGTWYYLRSLNFSYVAQQFGIPTDLPAVGDYDGDGKSDIAIWRANSSSSESAAFYVNKSSTGFSTYVWGVSGMYIPAYSLQNGN